MARVVTHINLTVDFYNLDLTKEELALIKALEDRTTAELEAKIGYLLGLSDPRRIPERRWWQWWWPRG